MAIDSPLGVWWRRLRGRPRHTPGLEVPTEMLGSEYGGYMICPSGLSPASVVYSFGIGEDVSFDLGMIERFGVTVHAFDPTPRSIAWLRRQPLPSGFVLHEYGLADFDGTARFAAPENPNHVSHRVVGGGPGGAASASDAAPGALEFPVKRLETVMAELGHARVDLLKLDIEGAEYAVIDALCENPSAGQLVLEFHHHLAGIPLSRTESAIDRLLAAGYALFHVSATGRELSFIRR